MYKISLVIWSMGRIQNSFWDLLTLTNPRLVVVSGDLILIEVIFNGCKLPKFDFLSRCLFDIHFDAMYLLVPPKVANVSFFYLWAMPYQFKLSSPLHPNI